MKSVLSKHDIEIPFYVSTSGTVIHAVVIPFDIGILKPSDVTYNEVSVKMEIRDGTKDSEDIGHIEVRAAIPRSVDRAVTVEEASKIAVSIAAVASELIGESQISGDVGAEWSTTESYARLYRKVTANIRSATLVSWTFTPFKDEPIFAGTYYVIALIEVRDPTREFLVNVHSECSYGRSILFGLFKESNDCIQHDGKLLLEQPSPPASGEPPVVPPEPPEPDEPSGEILKVAFLGKWGTEGDGDGQFRRPWGIGVSWSDGTVYVGDDGQASVQVFSPSGQFLGRLPGEIIGNFLAVDSNGLIYARNYDPATGRNERIEVFSPGDYELIGTFKLRGPAPRAIDVDIYGENIYVTDITEQKTYDYGPDGEVLAEWGSVGNGDGQFRDPWGVAVDRYQTGRIYVADTGNNRVQVFSSDGRFLNQWGTYGTGDGQFDSPIDVAVDTSRGNVYVLDRKNARVQVFNPEGEFLGKWGTVGRNDSEFLDPYGIVIDGNDNIYVLDSGNYRVQVFRVSFAR
ncbi:MAG: 6-bladed beta-propeller, partial [Planctomycetota bacterium]|jgi:DNA-binding beta-propeller fold protein YncE